MTRQTRGEANNNPGNIIKDTTTWLGQVPRLDETDKHFCQFDTPVHGIRALCKVLLAYQRLDQCQTLAQVISRYAPSVENNTEAYLSDVATRTGFFPDCQLDLTDPKQLAELARAIIWHENGRCIYDDATINRAANMALTY